MIIASFTDCLYIDIEKAYEFDIDEAYDITDKQEILYEENVQSFFILIS